MLTNAEFRSRMGRRLGHELCEESACPFCFGVMDRFGIHPECCMAGGDKTAGHHIIRNDLYGQSFVRARGGLRATRMTSAYK